jgi:guanylate kinase
LNSGAGAMLVISGPSGVGKTTLSRKLREVPGIVRVMTTTTRARREQEVDGRDYRFLDRAAFEAEIARDAFLEWAEIDGHLYGTPREEIRRRISSGDLVLVDIDPQGARSIRALAMPAYFVFLAPPDMEELKRRLLGRQSESPEAVRMRLARAEREMTQQDLYDAVVVNTTVERATEEILALLRAKGWLKAN